MELKPCPFCGGKAYLEYGFNYDYDGGDRWFVYSADVMCSCGCTLHVDNVWPKEYVDGDHMLDFAIAAWNTRAERTCEIDSWGGDNAMLTCGHEAPGYAKFCPNCGAKVVEV